MTWSNRVRTPFYRKEMVLDERIQIPHYAVGWGESCSAKLGVQCSYGGSILERELKGPSKKSEGVMGNLSLYVAREPPSTSLATVLAQKDRSFTCWSFASRTRSLATPFTHSLESDSITLWVWRIIRYSLSCYYPQGAQQPRCILSYRKRRSVAIRTTGKVSLTGRQ